MIYVYMYTGYRLIDSYSSYTATILLHDSMRIYIHSTYIACHHLPAAGGLSFPIAHVHDVHVHT